MLDIINLPEVYYFFSVHFQLMYMLKTLFQLVSLTKLLTIGAQ